MDAILEIQHRSKREGDHVAVDDQDVTITGEAGILMPGILIVVANTSRPGVAEQTAVAPDGSFSMTIEGTSGDVLVAFVVEPAASNGASGSMVGRLHNDGRDGHLTITVTHPTSEMRPLR